jgi:hypothetical protein
MENVQHAKIIDEICDYAEKNEIKVQPKKNITVLNASNSTNSSYSSYSLFNQRLCYRNI